MTSLPFNFELPIANDPAALPESPESYFRWATVVNVAPLSIRFDGETTPLNSTPSNLAAGVQPNDRVWVQIHGRSVVVIGRGAPSLTEWVDVPVNSPYTVQQPPFYNVQVRKSVDGRRVYLRGGVSNTSLTASTNHTGVLSLPGGFEPTDHTYYLLCASGNPDQAGELIVMENGEVDLRTGSSLGGYYIFDGLSWDID